MARAHTAGKEKHGNMATSWLRLLVFSSFCSGIPAAEKKEFLYAEIFVMNYSYSTSNSNSNSNSSLSRPFPLLFACCLLLFALYNPESRLKAGTTWPWFF
jgi:hypothetical protein